MLVTSLSGPLILSSKDYNCRNKHLQRKTPCGLNINVETIVKNHCEIILTDLINKIYKMSESEQIKEYLKGEITDGEWTQVRETKPKITNCKWSIHHLRKFKVPDGRYTLKTESFDYWNTTLFSFRGRTGLQHNLKISSILLNFPGKYNLF